MPLIRISILLLLILLTADFRVEADEAAEPPACLSASSFRDSWIKVGESICLKCHVAGGEAEDTDFVLAGRTSQSVGQPTSAPGDGLGSPSYGTTAKANYDAFSRMALRLDDDGRSRLIVKATGGLDHGGGEVLKAGSTELRVLQEYVQNVQQPGTVPSLELSDDDLTSFFDGVTMLSDQRLLRRVTLSLAARLPTDAERQKVASAGLESIRPILSELMKEDAFLQRLQEGFNDIFLTLGYNGNGEDVLSYNHFQHTRLWYQKHDLDHIPEQERQKAKYKLANDYRDAMRREPLELLRYIVENDRPFTEILTADYTMMSPYTARGYGLYDELKEQFSNPDDPFEFIPAKVKALTHRDGKTQPTADGIYPHAGLLSMFQYLRRYPTTETNRNRLRARMYYQHFLGVDIMNLAPRVSDAAAIDAKYKIPTMQAAECVVCHRTIDPVAGLFQDYYNEDGHYGPRKDGWFEDMFGPGREGNDLPEEEHWRALQWLAKRTVDDPRFAIAMAEHVYYILMGRKVLLPPDDIDDPGFAGRRRAYLAQREFIETAAQRFVADKFNLKVLFQGLVASPFYRADGLNIVVERTASPSPNVERTSSPSPNVARTSSPSPNVSRTSSPLPNTATDWKSVLPEERLAELDDVGLVRMLSPEQIERKIVAIFGKSWGRLDDSYAILYCGIDSKEVTERLTDPSGAIGALQRILANDVACKNVAGDFALPAAERRLFPNIETDVVPAEGDSAAEQKIRAAIVHLHQHILGRDDKPDDPEVSQTFALFVGIVKEAAKQQLDPRESYFCKSGSEPDPRNPDPHYTMRAWRAVVTYLLRQQEFLYE